MNILIIEDNKPEQVILQEAFTEAGVQCQLSMVNDGIEALRFMNQEGEFKDAPRPQLIILDLNLPRKNGREVLVEIKNNPQWSHIPILIFSNSESPRDIQECYSRHASAYLNKPSSFQEFVELACVINVFWVKVVRYRVH